MDKLAMEMEQSSEVSDRGKRSYNSDFENNFTAAKKKKFGTFLAHSLTHIR